jgi:predicted transposase/invertase (TIGR01784 family)
MSPIIHQRHDKLVKRSFDEKNIAIDFLKAHLLPDVYRRIDINTLELTDKSFVLPEFREIHSDVVYRCQFDQKELGYIFFLLEAESSAQKKLLPFYKLQYTVSLMDQHIHQGYEKLPIVLPICLYHGETSPYPHSRDIYHCFEDVELARQLAFKPFTLVDLTVLPDEEIKTHGVASLMEMLLKHSRDKRKELLSVLKQIKSLFSTISLQVSQEYWLATIHYTLDHPQDDTLSGNTGADEIVQFFITALPQAKEAIMTFTEQLELRGEQRGIQIGELRGKREEAIAIARNLLAKGVDLQTIKECTHLSNEDLFKLNDIVV